MTPAPRSATAVGREDTRLGQGLRSRRHVELAGDASCSSPSGGCVLTGNPIGPSAHAALRYAKSGKPQVVTADLAAGDHQRGVQAKLECGKRVWRRSVVVYITLRAYLPNASLSKKVFFVGRFKHGYRVWQVVH